MQVMLRAGLAAVSFATALASGASAQPSVEQFYKGKTST